MKASGWLKLLAGLLTIFTIGHTLGTAAPTVTRGAQEASVFAAMQSFRFPIMGFNRTYWELYRGFALIISLQLLVMAIMAWQLSAVGATDPRRALPMAITLQLGCIGLLVLGWMFFFTAPIVIAAVATACSTIAVVLLVKAARTPGLNSN
jgi:hypothetical protein